MMTISTLLARFCLNRPTRIIESGGKPYMYRVFLFRVWGWNCYLHHFVSADAERWLHDHPFNGFAFVLTGSYVEERLLSLSWPSTNTETRRVGWFNYVDGNCFHRILKPAPHTWTLFLHGPKFKGWGFLQAREDLLAYYNPFGNVGDTKWWETAPTYAALRWPFLNNPEKAL